MLFDIQNVYIGKIYSITGENIGTLSDLYAAFYLVNDDNINDKYYVLINRGQWNKNMLRIRHNSIFQTLDDIDWDFDSPIPSFYVDELKPIINEIPENKIKDSLSFFDIHFVLSKINEKEKTMKKKKNL